MDTFSLTCLTTSKNNFCDFLQLKYVQSEKLKIPEKP